MILFVSDNRKILFLSKTVVVLDRIIETLRFRSKIIKQIILKHGNT